MVENPEPDRPHSAPSLLELDHVFEALAHPRRRYLIYTLLEDEERPLEYVAGEVIAWEKDIPVESVTDADRERIFVSLYHNHIPKLVEDDIVEFVEADETIKPAANAEQVLNVLESAGGSGDSEQEDHARRNHDEGIS